jgi:hypothetical protein
VDLEVGDRDGMLIVDRDGADLHDLTRQIHVRAALHVKDAGHGQRNHAHPGEERDGESVFHRASCLWTCSIIVIAELL